MDNECQKNEFLGNQNKNLINNNEILKNEKNLLSFELNNEKNKNIKHINELNKKLEIQINNNRKLYEDYKRSALNLKNNFLKNLNKKIKN